MQGVCQFVHACEGARSSVIDSERNESDLLTEIRRVRAEREAELRIRFDRSLPFADGLFDRWERARQLGFGEEASIYDSAFVFGHVRVGARSWIGPNTILDGSGGGLTIGATCSVSAGVHIYTHDTVLWALSGGTCEKRLAPVIVGDCCYIGPQAVITAGVTIGSHCIIGANSLVAENVPDRTFVAGSPARVKGRIVGEGREVRIEKTSDEGGRA